MPEQATGEADERTGVLRRHLEAERSGDPEAILATFTYPRYELVGNGRVYDGIDEVRGYLVERAKAFPDLTPEVINFWHAADAVAAELWLSGTYRGTFPDVGPEGRRFRVRTACFFLFEASGLIGVRAYFDSGALARQLVS